MAQNLNMQQQFVILLIFVILFFILFIWDFIILCYWIKFKSEESRFQKAFPYIPTDESALIAHSEGMQQVQPSVAAETLKFDLPTIELPLGLATKDDHEPQQFDVIAIPTIPNPDAYAIAGDVPDVTIADSVSAASSDESAASPSAGADQTYPQHLIQSPFARTWSLVHPFLGFQLVLVVISLLQVVLLLPPMLKTGGVLAWTTYSLSITILGLIVQNIGFVAITAYFVHSYGSTLALIGLRAPTRREIALGLGYGAALCLGAWLLEAGLDTAANHFVSKQFAENMGKLNDSLSAGGLFEQIRGVPMQIGFILAGAIAAPIGEEVFFRGLLYNSLKRRWGVTAGIVVSAICFALMHIAPISVLVIVPMGVILALAYERTQSLWVTIIMHAINNGVQLVLAMYAINHAHAGH